MTELAVVGAGDLLWAADIGVTSTVVVVALRGGLDVSVAGCSMATVTGTEFPMGGVTVKFPYKPYPPQKAMMSKVKK